MRESARRVCEPRVSVCESSDVCVRDVCVWRARRDKRVCVCVRARARVVCARERARDRVRESVCERERKKSGDC